MNRPHYFRHPDGSRIRVQPGNRCDSQRDPSAVYESDLREMEAERIQTGPWQAKADVLDRSDPRLLEGLTFTGRPDMTWIIKRNGIRTHVIPGQRPGRCDQEEPT